MKSLLLVVALCGPLVCAFPIGPEDEHISDKDMAFAKLEVTGKADSTTLGAARESRCGVIDMAEFNHYPGSPKWRKKNITYSLQNYTPDMDRADVDESLEKGWKFWSDVAPLTFTRVYDDSADIKISFEVGCHCESEPFDGKGGILGHADGPYISAPLEVHFDEGEDWTKDKNESSLIFVAAHEFGHILGLSHSDVPGALMSEFYDHMNLTNSRLPQDDIDGIQKLYGARVNSSSAKNMLLPAEARELCDAPQSLDAASSLGKEILAFKDRFVWRKAEGEKFVKYLISSFWPALSRGVDAAYEVREENTLYLFKDDEYWAVKENFTMPGFPKKIRSLGFLKWVKKIDAAFHDERTKKTYFFTGPCSWRYDEATNSLEKQYIKDITVAFYEDLPKVDAALQDDELLYLFHDSEKYEFQSKSQSFNGNIEDISTWFGCK